MKSLHLRRAAQAIEKDQATCGLKVSARPFMQ
jgi:hypothetical protein